MSRGCSEYDAWLCSQYLRQVSTFESQSGIYFLFQNGAILGALQWSLAYIVGQVCTKVVVCEYTKVPYSLKALPIRSPFTLLLFASFFMVRQVPLVSPQALPSASVGQASLWQPTPSNGVPHVHEPENGVEWSFESLDLV